MPLYIEKMAKGCGGLIRYRGEVTSAKEPYEVFRIEELDKYDFIDNAFSTLTWKYNLMGDKGTRYIGTLIQDLVTGDITIGKTVCK